MFSQTIGIVNGFSVALIPGNRGFSMPKLYIGQDILHILEMARQLSPSRTARIEIDSLSIPPEIASSLCSCGGVEGLIDMLPPDDLIRRMEEWYKACADPVRLKVLFLLMVQPLCVCVIKNIVNIADSKLSYHLTILKKAGMIEGTQQGNYIVYHILEDARAFLERERMQFQAP
ncbi:MAG TPA: metalloregulator ArsR/SmtB family transcription factor [Methanolinea sp.]|nr:metalloregulator ArsR/SmtB family transcription factor [Methanolinea sp.]HQK55156.1 metalloregulator ArsR/SmtB family transcription factor [Methanolinea sp.]